MSGQLFRFGIAFCLLLTSAPVVWAPPCNWQISTPVWGQRCFEGWWCEWEECWSCPECALFCACDQIVWCLCNSQILPRNACWNMPCDDGGGTALPGTPGQSIQRTSITATPCFRPGTTGNQFASDITAVSK